MIKPAFRVNAYSQSDGYITAKARLRSDKQVIYKIQYSIFLRSRSNLMLLLMRADKEQAVFIKAST